MMAATRALPARRGGLKPAQALLDHRLAMAAIDLRQQPFLVAEVISDARNIDIGGAGEIADRNAVEAAFGEQPLGSLEDAVACPVLLLRAGGSRRNPLRRALGVRPVHFVLSLFRVL
jgi:hypothetical protein